MTDRIKNPKHFTRKASSNVTKTLERRQSYAQQQATSINDIPRPQRVIIGKINYLIKTKTKDAHKHIQTGPNPNLNRLRCRIRQLKRLY